MVDNTPWIDEKTELNATAPLITPQQKSMVTAGKVSNWLDINHESILFFGAPKAGKTMAYMSLIEKVVDDGGKVFVINTDNGFTKTFKYYFNTKEQQDKYAPQISFYYLSQLEDAFSIVPDILSKASSKDLIVIDLVSEIWEMAQGKFIEAATKGNPINYIINAERDSAKFGLFESSKWQYIKKLEGYIRKELVTQPKCNVVGVASEKDIDLEKIKTHNASHKYDVTGMKPAGSKDLAYDFSTVVYIDTDGKGKRFFQIVGDRGSNVDPAIKVYYENNFYKKFKEMVKR